MNDQRYGATKQEQTSSNVIKHHANHQILPAFPGRAYLCVPKTLSALISRRNHL